MIISASRRTDIPAFYSDWFLNRIKEQFVLVRNPFNSKLLSRIDLNPNKIDCIVFWTKNPKNIISRLEELKDYKYYFQFTLNPYDSSIELRVAKKVQIIKTFIELSQKIGKSKVIWRYDPIFLTRKMDIKYHIKYFNHLAEILSPYTEKCIISFLDLYKKCEKNIKTLEARVPNNHDIIELSHGFKNATGLYDLKIETCSEDIDLMDFGFEHGHCVDQDLIERIIGYKIKASKDKYQRNACGCIESTDIGEYNTCSHNCLYCYANYSLTAVKNNILKHDPLSPLITGQITKDCIIKDKNDYFQSNLRFK